jgi:cytochrome c oxidase subunit 3
MLTRPVFAQFSGGLTWSLAPFAISNKKLGTMSRRLQNGVERHQNTLKPMAHFRKNHPFHLVTPSYWPIVVSSVLGVTVLSLINILWNENSSNASWNPKYGFYIGLIGLIAGVLGWFNDLIKELSGTLNNSMSDAGSKLAGKLHTATTQANADLATKTTSLSKIEGLAANLKPSYGNILTEAVEHNLMLGMLLFIASEVMLFFSFFWAFFHSSLSPSIFLGNVWPPKGLIPVAPFEAPLLNTALLLSSGVTVNAFYYNLKGLRSISSYITSVFGSVTNTSSVSNGAGGRVGSFSLAEATRKPRPQATLRNLYAAVLTNWSFVYVNLIWTLVLGGIFLFVQLYEFIHANFTISDGVFGSTFYMLTGLHGMHVCLGLVMLIYGGVRLLRGDFDLNSAPHIGITCSVLYWHFVDVVWIFLFLAIYIGTGGAAV